MKTKLLKKIRKRFVIEYYPKDELYKTEGSYFATKHDAIEMILTQVRSKYKNYSVKNKKIEQQNKPIKVWYVK